MRIFAFDPADYRDRYREQQWVHVRGGIDPDFYAHLLDFAERHFSEHKVEGKAIGGAKTQALFEFPDGVNFPGELFDTVASLCGLNRATMTLSERHIKAYDSDVPPDPPAHKDRVSSQVSMGLSIKIPADSRLILYPGVQVSVNPFNVSPALRQVLEPDELPEVALKDAPAVEIDDSGGDVMLFPGSAVWHYRRNASNAVNLYLKFNDFDSDPLGEDPSTAERRARTLEAVSNGDGLDGQVVAIGRRLDTVTREHTRNAWEEVLTANVWDEKPFRISTEEYDLLRALDGGRPVAELSSRFSPAAIRRLAERGAVDLLPG